MESPSDSNRTTKVDLLKKYLSLQNGEEIDQITNIFSPLHLISSTNALGHTTSYSYDEAGNKIEELQTGEEETTRRTFTYDALGNIRNIHTGEQTHVTICDYHGKFLKETIEDQSGNPLHVKIHRPTKSKDTSEHHSCYLTNRDQTVAQTTTIDCLGNHTVTTYDSLSRPETIELFNARGELTDHTEQRHDGQGNKILERHTVTTRNKAPYTVTTKWKYGANNRLEAFIEAAGSPEETETRYIYNEQGQLKTIDKPDDTALHYLYDSFGNIQSLISSDGSIDYHYTYDLQGRIVSVNNSKRSYNKNHLITSEFLANGLSLQKEYDQLGRCTRLILPDGSEIHYRYNAAYLTDVIRIDTNGEQRYTHKLHQI